jgi:hypothetical protein
MNTAHLLGTSIPACILCTSSSFPSARAQACAHDAARTCTHFSLPPACTRFCLKIVTTHSSCPTIALPVSPSLPFVPCSSKLPESSFPRQYSCHPSRHCHLPPMLQFCMHMLLTPTIPHQYTTTTTLPCPCLLSSTPFPLPRVPHPLLPHGASCYPCCAQNLLLSMHAYAFSYKPHPCTAPPFYPLLPGTRNERPAPHLYTSLLLPRPFR